MDLSDTSRRRLLRGLGCCAGLPVAAALAGPAAAQEAAPQPRPTGAAPAPAGMTPDEALEFLRAGNASFAMDAPYRAVDDRARRLEIAAGQHPFCVLVGCSDSRVSPELLFGRGLGELFIIRVAGNTVDLAAQGSIEFAVAEFGVPLIVVLGHQRCGAVAAAVEVVEHNATFPGRIGDMVEPIVPAVLRARGEPGDLLENAVRANVLRVMDRLRASGELIREPLESGRLKIVGGYYGLEDGVVDFFDA